MAVSSTARVAQFLGGRKVLGSGASTRNVVAAVRQGLPYASLTALAEAFELDLADVGSVLGIPERTLARRKHQRQLSPVESDRLYRLAHVAELAASVFGNLESARLWLRRENRALGGVTPLSLLDTELGSRQVEETLTRLSHGIHA